MRITTYKQNKTKKNHFSTNLWIAFNSQGCAKKLSLIFKTGICVRIRREGKLSSLSEQQKKSYSLEKTGVCAFIYKANFFYENYHN